MSQFNIYTPGLGLGKVLANPAVVRTCTHTHEIMNIISVIISINIFTRVKCDLRTVGFGEIILSNYSAWHKTFKSL